MAAANPEGKQTRIICAESEGNSKRTPVLLLLCVACLVKGDPSRSCQSAQVRGPEPRSQLKEGTRIKLPKLNEEKHESSEQTPAASAGQKTHGSKDLLGGSAAETLVRSAEGLAEKLSEVQQCTRRLQSSVSEKGTCAVNPKKI